MPRRKRRGNSLEQNAACSARCLPRGVGSVNWQQMQFVKRFAHDPPPSPPPPSLPPRADGRKQASGSLLAQRVQSGMQVRPQPGRVSAAHGSDKRRTQQKIRLDLYIDCAASSACRRTPHYLESWCASRPVDHEHAFWWPTVICVVSALRTNCRRAEKPQHVPTAVTKIAKSAPCFGWKVKRAAPRVQHRQVDAPVCREKLQVTPGYLDGRRAAGFLCPYGKRSLR